MLTESKDKILVEIEINKTWNQELIVQHGDTTVDVTLLLVKTLCILLKTSLSWMISLHSSSF
jgi:hypothetical protein